MSDVLSTQIIQILKIMLSSNRLPIKIIAPMLCIYEIFTDNFAVCVGKQSVPIHHLSTQ